MKPESVDISDTSWETWGDPKFADCTKVRWKLIFSAERTSSGWMSMGLAEIAPKGILPLHQHDPAEIYHVLSGEGHVKIEGITHRLFSGQSIFIPPHAWHETVNDGTIPLCFLFTFPTDSFDQVVYKFADE